MYFPGIITAFVIALFISLLFSLGFKHKGPWGAIWIFFIIIFLMVWAGQLWIIPVGPVISNSGWLFLFFLGLIFALALAAPDAPKKSSNQQSSDIPPFTATIGIFFWVLVISLLLAVISGYIRILQ
jgi:hypothetical protein